MNWWIAKVILLGLWLSSFGTIAYPTWNNMLSNVQGYCKSVGE